MTATLADRIEKRIRAIPANNPGYVSFRQETLGDLLAGGLLRRIALEAAEEAMYPSPRDDFSPENDPFATQNHDSK